MRNRYVLLADLPLIAIAAFGAFALRFDWLFLRYRPEFYSFVIAALLIKPVVFYVFGMYRRYWRYASAPDLLAVTLAVSASSMATALYVGIGRTLDLVHDFSRPVVFIDWLLTLATIGGLRMSVRVISDARQKAQRASGQADGRRVLVVGAGDAGTLVVREMQKNPQLGLQPAGFLDDSPGKLGKRISGIPVLGPLSALADVVKAEVIDEVVVAMPTVAGAVVRAVAEDCRRAGVKSRAIPGIYELLDGKVSVSRLRNVEIADLLRRSQVVSRPETASYVAGRTVLVTGAGGSIGSELCRQVAFASPACLVLLGHGENSIFEVQTQLAEQYPGVRIRPVIADIRDKARIETVFEQFRPAVVFHAAAHKHLPLMEGNPQEAITNNVFGTAVVVEAAEAFGTHRLVLISTDKAAAPTSIMGASKRLAEATVREAATRSGRAFVAVRFGNVLGSRGSVVPTFSRQIQRGGPITMTHPDMKRFFMTIPEAVHLVLQAGGLGRGGELFVLKMGEPIAIVDLAKDLVRLSGLSPDDIPIVYTGLRPGEKLEEALWEDGAVVHATANPDLLTVVEADPIRREQLEAVIGALRGATDQCDELSIQAILAECIPSYVPGFVRS